MFIVTGAVWIGGNRWLRNRCFRRLGRPKPPNHDWVFSHNFPIKEYDDSERLWFVAIVICSIMLGFLSSGLLNGILS
jgi:hypothetical protein